MYVAMFGVDVPTTQSQPIESIQGTHRTTSPLRSPNPDVDEGELSAQRKSTVIRLCIPPRRIAKQKSRDDLEAKQNEEKVKEHLIAEEIKKLMEGTGNVGEDEVDNSNLNSQNDPGTRLDPESYKERTEVEKNADVQPVNVIKEEEESAEDDYELRRREKGKDVEETRNTPPPTPTRSTTIHSNLISLDIEKLQELTENDPTPSSSTPSLSSSKLSATQQVMEESLPKMVDARVKELTKTQLALKIKFEGIHASNTPCRSSVIHLRDQDDPHDDAHLEGENSAKRQKTSEHRTYVFRKSSSGQANESEPGPSTSVDEAKMHKVVNEMLRQRCTSGDEHQYHIDQMQNFLKNDIVWESRKEILTLPFPLKPTSVVQSCQRDPKSPALSLVNQDLLYLKKGNSVPKKFVLSLHKFHVTPPNWVAVE
ncbi:hypothetical protein Tco_0701467 [Tanacetum coccineum]